MAGLPSPVLGLDRGHVYGSISHMRGVSSGQEGAVVSCTLL